MPSEAQARITINRLLEEAGGLFLPDKSGRRENIICEHRAKKKVFAPNVNLGVDFEHTRMDFPLIKQIKPCEIKSCWSQP